MDQGSGARFHAPSSFHRTNNCNRVEGDGKSQWNVNGKTSITDGGPTLPSSVLQNRHLSESCFTSQDNPLLYSILKDTVHVCLCIQYIYLFN